MKDLSYYQIATTVLFYNQYISIYIHKYIQTLCNHLPQQHKKQRIPLSQQSMANKAHNWRGNEGRGKTIGGKCLPCQPLAPPVYKTKG